MAYEKPIEIKVVAPNLAGTEAKSVEAFMKLERLLTKTLAAGDIFKSPPASINTQTHDVTKSLFVRKDVEKLVTDTLIAHQDLFVEDLKIASKEARTKKYKVDIEGDRAITALKAEATARGGQVLSNQHGTQIEVPAYKGIREATAGKAEQLTKQLREKINTEATVFLTREQKEAKALEEAKLAAIEKEKEELKKKQGKVTDKWNKLTKEQEKSVQDEIDSYFAAEEKSKLIDATKAEAEAKKEKIVRAKLESSMNNKWQKLLFKQDTDLAAEEAKKAAEDAKVKKEVAKYFKKEDSSVEAVKARQEAKEAAAEAREKAANARELKRRQATMFRLIANKEESEAKEAKREEIKKQREAEKEKRQKEKEAEKEKKSAETDAKHRGLAMLAGFGTSILLLKKLVSLVENIVKGVIDAGEKSFNTTMDAMRLNIDPVVLRNLFYAGTAKGIGSAPVDILTTLQSYFGTTLLAAENVGKIDDMAPVIGEVIGDLIRNGQAGTDPMGMASAIFDSVIQAYKEGKNALGQTGGTQSANAASLITMLESSLGESAALILARMIRDIDTGKRISSYQSWITDAMPVSSPTNAQVASSAGSYSDYLVAIAELKSIIDLIKTTLSPLLDPLTRAIQKLNGFLLRLTGDTGGVAELNRKNHDEMQAAIIRDKAEVGKLESVEKDYLARNNDIFPDTASLATAVDNFTQGIIPTALVGDDVRLNEFFAVAATVLFKKKLQSNVASYAKKTEDFSKNEEAYALGQKTFTFADSDLPQSYAFAEAQFKNAMTKVDQGSFTVPATQQEAYMTAYLKATAARKEKEAIAAREAKIKQMAMDELVPQLSGPDQEFSYNRKNSTLRKDTEDRIRAEVLATEQRAAELKAVELRAAGKEASGYTMEDSIRLQEATAKALDEASARIILQGVDKTTDLGTATTAVVSRVKGEVKVVFFDSGKKEVGRVNVPVIDADASSIAENDTVKIDLYQQSE